MGFGPLAAFFVLASLAVLALGGRSRGYSLWLLLGAALGMAFILRTQTRFDALTRQYDGRAVALTACVEDVRAGYTRWTVRARLRVETAAGEPAAFCCWCDNLPLCEAGERVEGVFFLESPDPADRPGRYADGELFYADYQRRFVSLGPGESFRAWSARLQAKLSAALCHGLAEEEAGVLAAMVTGDRTRISDQMNDAYRAAGLSHVLVVSGMHVTILCGMGLPNLWEPRRWLNAGQKLAANLPGKLGVRLYRRLGLGLIRWEMRPPARTVGGFHPGVIWRQRAAALWPAALAVLLAGITGFTPSVLRAGAAVLIGTAGVWVMAPADALTSLALAGLGMSALNGYAVCDVGFELSFAAVAGTLAGAELARRGRSRPPEPYREPKEQNQTPLLRRLSVRLADGMWTAGCISLCASAATFPVLVLRGMSTSPYALVSGVAVLWMVQPLMVLGILAALAGMLPVLEPVYRVLALGAGLLTRLLNGWAALVAGWPGAQLSFDTGYAAAVCLILIALAFLADRWHVRLRVALPALLLTALVGIGAGMLLSRDVVQVALVGGSRTPSVILAQNGQAVVLYRGGSTGRTAVEDWLTRHNIRQASLLVDLRSDPTRVALPEAERVVTAARLGEYSGYRTARGDIEIEVLHLRSGSAVRVTVDRWQMAAVSGDFELASPVEVDWLLASPADPSAFRWRGLVVLGDGYDWMTEDAPRARRLLLRPGGGVSALT